MASARLTEETKLAIMVGEHDPTMFKCEECDHIFAYEDLDFGDSQDKPHFCPSCGRRNNRA